MKKIFDMDGGLMTFLSRIADLLILNVIFIITCIPIITIGPALTALYSVTLKMVKNEDAYIFKSYLKAFKDNFKISLFAWLILLFAFGLLYADYRISGTFSGSIKTVLTVAFLAVLMICLMVTLYLFPYIARFTNTLKDSFKNALLLAIASLPFTVLLVVITGGVAWLSLYVIPSPHAILIWLCLGFALLAFVNSFIFRKVFAKYEPTTEETDDNLNQ